MTPLVSTVNQILSLLTIIAQILSLGLIIGIVFKKGKILDFISQRAVLLSLVVALTATLGSLFYSEVAGFAPCKLCWYERIFMYPQVILLGLALLKKNHIVDYILGLSLPGIVITGYHYLLQIGTVPSLACSTVGYSVSCTKVFVMNFGYVTIPLMALSAFLLIILLQLIIKNSPR